MKIKAIVSLSVLALVASILVAPVGSAAPAPKTTVLGTDEAGDWGCNQDCTFAPLGAAIGQDLVQASMSMADASTVNFIIEVAGLPPSGGIPEFSRYTWDFAVDGNPIQMSGNFTEYARGICNPTYNPMICPPPRDPGSAPFFLRVGGCTVGGPCEEIGLAHGVFDTATGTITIPVPLEVLEAKPGAKITPGASLLGGTIYAAPAAVVTQAALPHDTMTVLETFVVPKAKKKKK